MLNYVNAGQEAGETDRGNQGQDCSDRRDAAREHKSTIHGLREFKLPLRRSQEAEKTRPVLSTQLRSPGEKHDAVHPEGIGGRGEIAIGQLQEL